MGCCGCHRGCGYHSDCLPDPGLGGALAISLNDFGGVWCGYANEDTCRRIGSWSYVLATVCERRRRRVGRIQGLNSRSR